jgi:hypothetical protein
MPAPSEDKRRRTDPPSKLRAPMFLLEPFSLAPTIENRPPERRRRPAAGGFRARDLALAVALTVTGCAIRHPLPEVTNEVPPEVRTRLFGRWTCGSELPRGRPTSTFELLRHLGPGKAWDLEVDEDGLATLQVVGHHGRARQGCWTEMTPGELETLEDLARDTAICDRPEDPRTTEPHNAVDVDLRVKGATCTKHFGAPALLQAAQGKRFVNGTQHLLDDIAGGSFRRMEDVVTSMSPATPKPKARTLPPNVAAVAGRLTCAKDRPTIYEPGDPWLLQYEFQKGLLWRRDIEVSARGAVGIEFASLQNEAKYSCTGDLTPKELADLKEALQATRPCELTSVPPRARDDHGYVSVHRDNVDCRYRPLRQEDLRASANGRRFEQALTTLVADLTGPGGVDPFDPERGVLVDKKRTGPGKAGKETRASPNGDGAGSTFSR